MSALFFISILLDRQPDIMSFLSFSALYILVFEPNLVFDIGFQLSFLAVLGLTSIFKLLSQYNFKTSTNKIYLKPIFFVYVSMLSSIVAEISTLFMSIYHFNSYKPFAILANIIAIPIANFMTIPLITFAIFLFPLGLEKYVLVPAGWSAEIILDLSRLMTKTFGEGYFVASPNSPAILCMLFGFIWFTLWEEKWRFLAIFIFILGILISIFKKGPNIVIDKRDNLITIIDKNNELYFSNDKNKFKIDVIKKKIGIEEHFLLKDKMPKLDEFRIFFMEDGFK
jgi:competence protein ComEC